MTEKPNWDLMRDETPFIGNKFRAHCCDSIIQSMSSGQLSSCKCGEAFVDQTKFYVRTSGKVSMMDVDYDD